MDDEQVVEVECRREVLVERTLNFTPMRRDSSCICKYLVTRSTEIFSFLAVGDETLCCRRLHVVSGNVWDFFLALMSLVPTYGFEVLFRHHHCRQESETDEQKGAHFGC